MGAKIRLERGGNGYIRYSSTMVRNINTHVQYDEKALIVHMGTGQNGKDDG